MSPARSRSTSLVRISTSSSPTTTLLLSTPPIGMRYAMRSALRAASHPSSLPQSIRSSSPLRIPPRLLRSSTSSRNWQTQNFTKRLPINSLKRSTPCQPSTLSPWTMRSRYMRSSLSTISSMRRSRRISALKPLQSSMRQLQRFMRLSTLTHRLTLSSKRLRPSVK